MYFYHVTILSCDVNQEDFLISSLQLDCKVESTSEHETLYLNSIGRLLFEEQKIK